MDELYPNIEEETKYPMREWWSELRLLIDEVNMKTTRVIYLLDDDMIVGIYSPYFKILRPETKNRLRQYRN